MSKIDELIKQYYPGGVNYVSLGEITEEHSDRNNSRMITEVRSVTNSVGLIKTDDFFENSRTSENTANYKVVMPGMLVYNPSRINVGSIALHAENIPVIVSPMYVVVGTDINKVIPEYLELYLKSEQGKSEILSKVEVGARFRLTYKSFARIRIPLPTLEAQTQIVNLLSKFTLLETKLEAEREARQLQFEYYRDRLFEFANQSSVKLKPLAEIGEFIRGRRFTKADYVDDGISCIHYGEIYTHYGTSTKSVISHVRSELAPSLRYAHPGDVIIAAVGETVEDVAKAVAWLGNEDVAIHDDCFMFRHTLNPKFVAYYFQTTRFRSEKNKHVARAKVKRISGEGLGKILMPVPDRKEQDRVVEVLDKFDALLNDSSVGLKVEIRARRNQYEYYRNKLMTFQGATI